MGEGTGEWFLFVLPLLGALVIGLLCLTMGIVRKRKSTLVIGAFLVAIPVAVVALVLLVNVVDDRPSTTTVTAPVSSTAHPTGVVGRSPVPLGLTALVEGDA